jgi:monoamine oxidase
MHKLEDLKDMLCEELEEYGTKDKLDMGGLEIVDKLAHAIKNIDKIIDKESGYSERYYEGNYGRDYYADGSYRGAYADGYSSRRGRTGNVKRDSMGRYARANDMRMEIERLMDEAPDEATRMKLERFMQSM